jgi:hypothetical protein
MAGSGPTNSRSDRITQAISASEDAIGRAVSGKTSARLATDQSRAFAKLATRDGAKPSDFGRRRLLSGEATVCLGLVCAKLHRMQHVENTKSSVALCIQTRDNH